MSKNALVNKAKNSEEECVFAMCDDVEVDVVPYHLHAFEQVGGYRADDDAVVVVVERLHLCEVTFDALVFVDGEVCEEDGLLYAVASHPLKVFDDVVSHLVALDVVHDEE